MNILVSPLLFVTWVALMILSAFLIVLILAFKRDVLKQVREIRFVSFLRIHEESWSHLHVIFFHEFLGKNLIHGFEQMDVLLKPFYRRNLC